MCQTSRKSAFNTKYYFVAHLGSFGAPLWHTKTWTNRKPIFSDAVASGEDMKTQDKKNNSFRIRVYDDELLTSLYELARLKEFASMNELICTALGIGVEKMYIERGKRKAFSANDVEESDGAKLIELIKRSKDAIKTLDDVFVMLNVVEMLMSTLYNIELNKIVGETVSRELIESGYLSDLPSNIRRVKDSLVKRLAKKEN